MNFRAWLHTLLSAFIGGSASAGAAVIVDPQTFNLSTPTGFHKLLSMMVIGGAVPALAFLHKSPLWEWGTPAPSGTSSKSNSVYKSVIIFAWLAVTIAAITGCTSQQVQTVANEIVAWLPAIDTGIASIDNLIVTFQPSDAATVAEINAALKTASTQFTAVANAYQSKPSASTLADLQAGIVALQQSTNQAVLDAYRVTDPASQAKILTAVNAVAAAANTVLALVASVSNKTQVQAMRQRATVKLSQVPTLGRVWDDDPHKACDDLQMGDCSRYDLLAWADEYGF